MTRLEDSEIIALFYERSEQAISELEEKYGATVKKVAANILGNALDVEECVCDTYLGVWNTIPPQNPDPLKTYVCKIARNLAIKKYHFTVESMVMDENGIGVLTYTMENPDGFDRLVVSDHGSRFRFEEPSAPGDVYGPNIWLTGKDGEKLSDMSFLNAQRFIAEGNSTDTKKEIVVYFAPFQTIEGAAYLTLEFSVAKEHTPDAMLLSEMCDEGSILIPLGEPAAAPVHMASEGWGLSVSPLGLVLAPPAGHDFSLALVITEDVVIHYSDGTDYILEREAPYTVNTIMSNLSSEDEILTVFNRLIDPAAVESVTVSGYIDDGYTNKTPLNLTFER